MPNEEQIKKIRCFLGWFEDNFGEESFLMEEYNAEDDAVQEKWISYLDHPEYLGACEALNDLENNFTNPS